MLLLFVSKALALDIEWWIECIFFNLQWLFMFYALYYFLVPKPKHSFKACFMFFLNFYAAWQIMDFTGWNWFTTTLPLFFLAFRAFLLTLEGTRWEKHTDRIGLTVFFLVSWLIS